MGFLWFLTAAERGWRDGVHMRRVHELTMQPVCSGRELAELAEKWDTQDWIKSFSRDDKHNALYLEGFCSGYLESGSYPKE